MHCHEVNEVKYGSSVTLFDSAILRCLLDDIRSCTPENLAVLPSMLELKTLTKCGEQYRTRPSRFSTLTANNV